MRQAFCPSRGHLADIPFQTQKMMCKGNWNNETPRKCWSKTIITVEKVIYQSFLDRPRFPAMLFTELCKPEQRIGSSMKCIRGFCSKAISDAIIQSPWCINHRPLTKMLDRNFPCQRFRRNECSPFPDCRLPLCWQTLCPQLLVTRFQQFQSSSFESWFASNHRFPSCLQLHWIVLPDEISNRRRSSVNIR